MARWMAAVMVVLSLIATSGSAAAHGGGTAQLVDEPVGPYRLYLWSKPDPLRVGDAHFTIGVFEPPAGDAADIPVLDATVDVSLEPQSAQAAPWSGRASRELSVNKLYYELDFELPAVGSWRTVVRVEGPAGSGQADFELEVLPPARVNWALLGGGGAVLLAAGWWWWNSHSQGRVVEGEKEPVR